MLFRSFPEGFTRISRSNLRNESMAIQPFMASTM